MNVSYRKYHALKGLVLLLGIVLVLLLAFFATTVGVMDTIPLDVPRALISFFQGNLEGNAHYKVIVLMRLPRTVMAVLAGIGLAIAGVAMQGCTSNPLVSPFTVGISSSAAFGASLMILFGGALATNMGIVLAAFSAAMACAVLVYGMSRVTGMKPETMVLVGTALSYLFSAGTSLLEIFADEHKLSEVVRWSFGSVNGATWPQDGIVALFVTVCSLVLILLAPKINVMMMGDDVLAKSMGIRTDFLRSVILIVSVLMTAAIISYTGVIGFVGLIAPHIGRRLIGEDNRYLIPFSGIIGGVLLLLSDISGRSVMAPAILPVGIIISFLGVPVFLSLIWKRGRS